MLTTYTQQKRKARTGKTKAKQSKSNKEFQSRFSIFMKNESLCKETKKKVFFYHRGGRRGGKGGHRDTRILQRRASSQYRRGFEANAECPVTADTETEKAWEQCQGPE